MVTSDQQFVEVLGQIELINKSVQLPSVENWEVAHHMETAAREGRNSVTIRLPSVTRVVSARPVVRRMQKNVQNVQTEQRELTFMFSNTVKHSTSVACQILISSKIIGNNETSKVDNTF